MYLSRVPSLLFAVEPDRMDTWVIRVSFAIPLVCLVVLGLWQLVSYLSGKLSKKPRVYRQSPEPPEPFPFSRHAIATAGDEPQRLEQACTALEESLAERYLELGESWLRQGQREKAVAVFGKILQLCPDRRQALVARERLKEIGAEERAS